MKVLLLLSLSLPTYVYSYISVFADRTLDGSFKFGGEKISIIKAKSKKKEFYFVRATERAYVRHQGIQEFEMATNYLLAPASSISIGNGIDFVSNSVFDGDPSDSANKKSLTKFLSGKMPVNPAKIHIHFEFAENQRLMYFGDPGNSGRIDTNYGHYAVYRTIEFDKFLEKVTKNNPKLIKRN